MSLPCVRHQTQHIIKVSQKMIIEWKSERLKSHSLIYLMTCVFIIRETAFTIFQWELFYNDVHIF